MEGTQARARASTRGHSFSADPFGLRDFRTRGDPRLPLVPAPDLDGKEGVDGSSPSEGSAKMPHVGAFAYVFSRSEALWGTDGAVYGAFASTTPFRPALKRESPRVTPACLV
jgi:hypothetical protein